MFVALLLLFHFTFAYYENPYHVDCQRGELNMSVTDVPGLYCAPKCSNLYPTDECPQQKPDGMVALAECMIAVNSTENNYCALICNTDAVEDQCGGENTGATCHHVYGNQGVCTYSQLAPEEFQLQFLTDIDGFGAVVLNITRKWAPLGVDHLFSLVQDGFYDGAAFFRVVPGFVVQFGISGTPSENIKWHTEIKDDPVVKSNLQWTMSYATAGPNTRTTQLFINFKDNTKLDASGFAPIGVVSKGTEYLLRVHDPTPGDNNGVNQQEYAEKGDEWIRQQYPEINFIKKATILVNGRPLQKTYNKVGKLLRMN